MIDVQIPQIGESITTVFVARWLKAPGDRVEAGEAVVEVDSDKATMEVPAPQAGVLVEKLAAEGDELAVGAVVARLGDADEAPQADAKSVARTDEAPAKGDVKAEKPASDAGEVRAGPAARAAARSEGVDLGDVEGTGPRGRVTRGDVERSKAPPAAKPDVAPKPVAAKPAAPAGRVERVAMSPLRRTIARRLVEAQQTAAMLTTFNECDLSAIMELRKKHQDRFVEKYGIKLGFMSFFVKAAVSALQQYPAVNAEIDGNDILYKRYYSIGVAVSGPKGLMVPILRDADRLSFAEVELGIAELAKRARDGKLLPSDFEDGTFTISNGGVFGSMMSTPILNPPQVGILGMHNILDRPIAVDGQVVIRPMMYLALSYDHRIIDGREAVGFLKRIKELVEDPERLLIEA